ncbi:MAG TPA: hypothetical protein VKK19_00280, partial [Candidatus Dormibacteraeota bacterium]|nr:hypothetical protein [Candidatus Dormibacteraeota bacterium]
RRINGDRDHAGVGDLDLVLQLHEPPHELLFLGSPPTSVEVQHQRVAAGGWKSRPWTRRRHTSAARSRWPTVAPAWRRI